MSTATNLRATYAKPLPKIDNLNAPFWEHACRHELALQTCSDCGDAHYPASPVCPSCLSSNQEWRIVSGRGKLVSWIVFHRAYWDAFKDDLPYTVCLIELAEGPRLYSNLVDVADADIAIGKPVKVVFDDVTAEITLPKFTLA